MPKIGPTTNLLLSATNSLLTQSVTHTLNLHFPFCSDSRVSTTVNKVSLSLSSQPPSATRPACAVTWGGNPIHLGRAKKEEAMYGMGWAGYFGCVCRVEGGRRREEPCFLCLNTDSLYIAADPPVSLHFVLGILFARITRKALPTFYPFLLFSEYTLVRFVFLCLREGACLLS